MCNNVCEPISSIFEIILRIKILLGHHYMTSSEKLPIFLHILMLSDILNTRKMSKILPLRNLEIQDLQLAEIAISS